MSVRPVLLWPEPALTMICEPVDSLDPTLIPDLFDTMYAARGRGLAAPQIGVLQRVFVVDVSWKEGARTPLAFVNPVVQASSVEVRTMDEQCLSIPDLPMPVARPVDVTLAWETPDGARLQETFTGTAARCIQHELDHLDGRVILDHQLPTDRAALEARYAS